MTVTALPTVVRHGTVPGTPPAVLADAHRHATSAATLVHEATAHLLAALDDAVAAAAARGINDVGARRTAAALRDARLALDFAVVAAGHALADRDVHLPVHRATALPGEDDEATIAS